LKPSRYSHFFPFSTSQSIAYNALSNALAMIENDKLAVYKQFVESGREIEDTQLREELIQGAFLLEEDIDEIELVRYNMLRVRYATNTFCLTIAPTSACNFRCIYCYEKDALGHEYMSESVQNAIVKMLDGQKAHIETFTVTWFGGEPLLALPIIQQLSGRLIELCKKEGITYNANMITNGYLLTRETLRLLKELKIDFIQVTLDGNPEQHDSKRPLADGSGTFWTVMNNLRDGNDLLPQVSLRVNVDLDNISAGEEINHFLDEYGLSGKVIPYYGRIRSDKGCYDEQKCIRECDFAEIEYNFALESRKGRRPSTVVRYPTSKTAYCGADSTGSYVVAADGTLYKCYSDIGNEGKRVGNILESPIRPNSTYLRYMLFDPTVVQPCNSCSILPICMGGCPFQRDSRGSHQCSSHKYILERSVRNAASTLICSRKTFKNDD